MSAGEKRKPEEIVNDVVSEKYRKEEDVTTNVYESNFDTIIMSWIVEQVRKKARDIVRGNYEVKITEVDKLLRLCRPKFPGWWKIELRKYTGDDCEYSMISASDHKEYKMVLNFKEAPDTLLIITNYIQ